MTFFSFWITRTSVNADVLGRSPEVRVNEVLLYLLKQNYRSQYHFACLLFSKHKNILLETNDEVHYVL